MWWSSSSNSSENRIVMKHTIENIINYIELNLDKNLTLELLSKRAGYSPFHFSRVFKDEMGESIIAYISRLRLERSATDISMKNSSLLEIAQDAGYQTATGFLKAFKKRFNETPSQYKHESSEYLDSFENVIIQEPKPVDRDDCYIIYIRKLGSYDISSEEAWEELITKLDSLETFVHLSEIIGICYDEPEITEDANIRYEAGIVMSKKEVELLEEKGFSGKLLLGGKYLETLHKGYFLDSDETYNRLYLWAKQHDYTLRDAPSIEVYLNAPHEVCETELLTYIYLPIV